MQPFNTLTFPMRIAQIVLTGCNPNMFFDLWHELDFVGHKKKSFNLWL